MDGEGFEDNRTKSKLSALRGGNSVGGERKFNDKILLNFMTVDVEMA